MNRRLGLFSAVFLLCSLAHSQTSPNIQRGVLPTNNVQSFDLDTINAFNGNLTIVIPLGQVYRINNYSYSFKLTYSANVWDYIESTDHVDPVARQHCNAGMGWTVSFGRIIDPSSPLSISYSWMYESPDGANHQFHFDPHRGFDSGIWNPTSYYQTGSSVSYYDSNTGLINSYIASQDVPGNAGNSPPNTDNRWAVLSSPEDHVYTRDGNYWRMDLSSQSSTVAELPDGTSERFNSFYLPDQLKDAFGNAVNIRYLTGGRNGAPASGNLSYDTMEITDSLNRRHYIDFTMKRNDLYSVPTVSTVDLAGPNGTRMVYTFDYEYPCTDLGVCGVPLVRGKPFAANKSQLSPTALVALLKSVTLPDGTSYSMSDSETQAAYIRELSDSWNVGTVYNAKGLLKKMKLPTGATIEWHFGDYAFPGVESQITRAEGVRQRTVMDAANVLIGNWTYSPQLGPNIGQGQQFDPGESTTTITDPLGNITKDYFSVWQYTNDPVGSGWTLDEYGLGITHSASDGAGHGLSSSFFDAGWSLQNPIRQSYVTYEKEGGNSRINYSRTTFRDDDAGGGTSRFSDVTRSNFDGLGHYRNVVSGGNFAGTNTRTAFTNFNPDSGSNYPYDFVIPTTAETWLINDFPDRSVTENGVTGKEEFCVDAHTGVLKAHRMLQSTTGARSTADVLARFTVDSAGNTTGQDVGFAVDTSTAICALGFTPARRFYEAHTFSNGVLAQTIPYNQSPFGPMPFKSYDVAPDYQTDLPLWAKDAATVQTNFEYDSMGRVRWVKPTENPWTEYTYTPALNGLKPQVTITTRPNNQPVLTLAQQILEYDDLGRLTLEKRRQPDNSFAQRKTVYNALGWVTARSEWEATSPTHWTTFEYDGQGRVTKVHPPNDNQASDYTISTVWTGVTRQVTTVKRQLIADLTATTRSATLDRFGRLASVTEDSSGGPVTTQYLYDYANRLRSGTSGAQTRTWTYDGRGFLTAAYSPEEGSVTYSNHDALGQHSRSLRGAAQNMFDLSYVYDDAGRITDVKSWGTSNIALKHFTYGTENVTASNGRWDLRLGKLVNTERVNAASGSFDITVYETYQYGGLDGAVSQRDTTTSTGESFRQTFASSYDAALGQWSEEIGYPVCLHAGCSSSSRVITEKYRDGVLTQVPGYATMNYFPSSLVQQISHTNGVNDVVQIDASSMIARPQSITFSGWNDQGACIHPAVLSQPGSISITSGQSTVLSVGASGSGTVSYQWYKSEPAGAAYVLAGTSSSISVSPTSSAYYIVRVTNNCGYQDSLVATVTVYASGQAFHFLNPNPISVCDGTGLGITNVNWNFPSAQIVQIRLGSPSGPLFAQGGSSGVAPTGKWTTNGMQFYAQNVTGGLPLTSANTLGIDRAGVTCYRATPNPAQVCDGTGLAQVTLNWSFPDATDVEIHLGSPTGSLFAHLGSSASVTTGKWVTSGMSFYAQNRTGGLPLTPANTLGLVNVGLTTAGCP